MLAVEAGHGSGIDGARRAAATSTAAAADGARPAITGWRIAIAVGFRTQRHWRKSEICRSDGSARPAGYATTDVCSVHFPSQRWAHAKLLQ